MKNKLIAISLATSVGVAGIWLQKDGPTILRVIDGDTVVIKVDSLPDPLPKRLSLRILGIDTPEKTHLAKCPEEVILAERASKFTQQAILNARKYEIKIEKWDKYGGRVLGDIILDGRKLSKLLIDNGMAVEYNGKGEKKDWCNVHKK